MSEQPRWAEPRTGYSDLSTAVDEIYTLRSLLAYEADVLSSHLSYKTFPKSRREHAERQVERMRAAAAGDLSAINGLSGRMALARIGIDGALSNAKWAEQRGLERIPEEPT